MCLQKNMLLKTLLKENVLILVSLVILVKIVLKKSSKLNDRSNQLKIDNNDKEELIHIFELRSSESSNINDFSSNNSNYHSATGLSDSSNIKIGCKDSYYKIINVLTKCEEQEYLLITIIRKITNPKLKEKYLKKLKKTIVR